MNHLLNRQSIFGGELEVPLIVRRNTHDGARAIVGQDVIGNPDGHALAVVGLMAKAPSARHVSQSPPGRLLRALFFCCSIKLIDLRLERGIGGSETSHQRIACGASCTLVAPKNRVHPRSEKREFGSFLIPDP